MTTVIEVPYHIDESLVDFESPLPADITVHYGEPPGPDRWSWLGSLYERVADAVAGTDDLPVVVSGDCPVSLGTVAGLQRRGLDPAVVWFDAHGDVQSLETSHSGYLGGIPLRIMVGYRPELVTTRLGLRPVPPERVVLVDARDLDPPEVEFLATSAIRHVELSTVESTVELPDGPLYLHLDLDVVDPDQLPALLFPAPGGPSLTDLFGVVGAIMATGRVVGVGLACTWRPGHGSTDLVRPFVTSLLR